MDYNKLYFDYLINLIDDNGKADQYSVLLEHLYYYDFVWLKNIPLDENRAKDGLQLRSNYKAFLPVEEYDLYTRTFIGRECSILEMFVAFAEKLTYIVSSMKVQEYFWLFIDNLGLNWATNNNMNFQLVNAILQAFLYGTKLHPEDENPPVLFPCREVFENLDKDLYMQANYYLKYYFL